MGILFMVYGLSYFTIFTIIFIDHDFYGLPSKIRGGISMAGAILRRICDLDSTMPGVATGNHWDREGP